MANFAPYQDTPEASRALSPPLPSPRASLDRQTRASLDRTRTSIDRDRQTRNIGTASASSPLPSPSHYEDPERVAWNAAPSSFSTPGGFGGPREDVDMFSTRLGIRMDYEACLAYLLLPPAGGALLLVLEHRSDYVRFHAWQSSLLFGFLFVVHIIFSWSSIISWLLFVCDLGLIGFLVMHAYQDADTLDRYEVPFFGPLASSILDDE